MKILNQMAESSFFNFPSLKDSEQIAQPNDDNCLESEDEYDAFNDETFGLSCECGKCDVDWELQHEKFVFEKSSSKQDEIVGGLKDLVLSPSPLDLTGSSVWAYTPKPNQNGKTSPIACSVKSDDARSGGSGDSLTVNMPAPKPFLPNFPVPPMSSPLSKICTVEELEKNLIKTNHNSPPNNRPPPGYRPMAPQPNFYLPFPRPPIPPTFQGHQQPYQMGMNRYPPGFPPQNMAPPMRHVMYPPRYRPMPAPSPHHAFMKGGNMQQRPPPGMPYPHQLNQGHIQRPGMHMLPPHLQMLAAEHQYHNQQHMQYHHQNENTQIMAKTYRDKNVVRDEYEGLMSSREKQWLLNIQLLQLNTGTPYFDDYYYTIYKERKARNTTKEHQLQRHRAGPRPRRNSDRQENNPLTPKIYTPQQFENSLGKLQCGSVMAPRKIIDMDVVSCEKDADCSLGPSSKDTRKTKQLLLELEMLYTMFLKAEDLTNPLAISNLKTLKEIRLKQRFRELENATTQEQKREILATVRRESETVSENPQDYMQKIVQGLLQEDKFTSFMNIRKGKMLLLRLLPTLHAEQYRSQVTEIWSRLLSSLPIIGRRDTVGDKILPKFYPLFKRYSLTMKMSEVLDVIQGLTETTRLDNSRSTPMGHQSKAPLYFVLMNQFGISATASIFVRGEYLITSTDSATEVQQMALFNFIQATADTLSTLPKISSPLERMSLSTFEKLSGRIPNLNSDKFQILKKHFVESEE